MHHDDAKAPQFGDLAAGGSGGDIVTYVGLVSALFANAMRDHVVKAIMWSKAHTSKNNYGEYRQ